MSKLPEKVQYLLDNDVEDYSFILKDKINAIIDYLEQYEQQKPCEHTEKRWVSMIDAFICQDCKRII